VTKQYISAQQLLDDSFNLAIKVLKSDYRPNFIAGVWRGGAPVGIAVQELLAILVLFLIISLSAHRYIPALINGMLKLKYMV